MLEPSSRHRRKGLQTPPPGPTNPVPAAPTLPASPGPPLPCSSSSSLPGRANVTHPTTRNSFRDDPSNVMASDVQSSQPANDNVAALHGRAGRTRSSCTPASGTRGLCAHTAAQPRKAGTYAGSGLRGWGAPLLNNNPESLGGRGFPNRLRGGITLRQESPSWSHDTTQRNCIPQQVPVAEGRLGHR